MRKIYTIKIQKKLKLTLTVTKANKIILLNIEMLNK